MISDEERENKLHDIKALEFGETLQEIVSSLEILLMMFEIDDDPTIIAASKERLKEGVDLLKRLNYPGTDQFNID